MLSEREQQISPLVPESIIHNTKILSQLHNLTASLTGITAGILGLESYPGFLFYIALTLLTTTLFYLLRVAPLQARYGSIRVLSTHQPGTTGSGVPGAAGAEVKDGSGQVTELAGTGRMGVGHSYHGALGFWTSGLVDGASGFVLTWTLAYGLVRA